MRCRVNLFNAEIQTTLTMCTVVYTCTAMLQGRDHHTLFHSGPGNRLNDKCGPHNHSVQDLQARTKALGKKD